jgi:hypothetical protein
VISFADNFSGQVNMLKDFRYGLYMGAFFVPLIGLLHIFPSNRSDDEIDGWIFAIYLATFLYYGTAGFLSVRRSQRVWDGVRIGAFTALLGVAFIIASFALFDNIFFATVSQQLDKIRGFEVHRNQFVSMRAYINWSHLDGAFFVLPVFGLIGAACSGIGGVLVSQKSDKSLKQSPVENQSSSR